MTPSRASKVFEVPRKTIMEYIKGKSKFGSVSGRGFYLEKDEEEDLHCVYGKPWMGTK